MDKEIFKNGLLEEGYSICEKKENMFLEYSNLLVSWNEKINLTALTEPKDISVKHFLDSIIPIFKINIPQNAKIIDVGTGAGFPGIPIKIIRDDLNFTFLDSLNKRISFLKEVSEKLEFKDVEFVHGRAEEKGRDNKYREKYDFAVSRAVAPLKILSEYCIPFVKKGGIFAAFKSYDILEEIEESRAMIGNLGAKINDIVEIKIPNSDIMRRVVLIEKVKETPSSFPRRENKIKKG